MSAFFDALDKPEAVDVDDSPKHPSLAFYRGYRPVHVRTVPSLSYTADGRPHDAGADKTSPAAPFENMFIIKLHRTLMPPCEVDFDRDVLNENYAQQIACEEGLEFLRFNWHHLIVLLFPFRVKDEDTCASNSSNDVKQLRDQAEDKTGDCSSAAEPIANAVECITTPFSNTDMEALRHPGMLDRVHYSYVVLLRFFGWRLHDEERGVLDRHRNWESRYAMLGLGLDHRGNGEPSGESTAREEALAVPQYSVFDFYASAFPRVVRSLMDCGLLRYAVRLVEFCVEEIACGRLVALLPLVESELLPIIYGSEDVDQTHKQRLRKKVYRLTHSDSD